MNIVRSFFVVLFLLLCTLATFQSGAASQLTDIRCGSFNNDQAAAQEYFDTNGQPDSLDGNGDGQACASPEDGDFSSTGPSAGNDEVTCGSFNNDQPSAQEYFDTHGQPAFLDGDGDGLACTSPEDGDYTSTGPSAGPEEEDPSTADEADGSDEDTTAASDDIQSLPTTGMGSSQSSTSSSAAILTALSIITGAVALQSMRTARR